MTPRLVLGLLAAAYATLVVGAGAHPRAWGVHLAGFLEGPVRTLVLGALTVGAGLLLWSGRPSGSREPHPEGPGGGGARPPQRRPAGTRGPRLPAWTALLLLPPLVWMLHALRVRTHLLGDGQVWIDNLVAGSVPAYGEPLSSAAWNAYGALLRALHVPVAPPALAWFPAVLGAAAAVLLFLLGRELATTPRARAVSIALLAGLGTSQLFFGYIESYPVACVTVLAYLLALQRAARGAAPVWLVALALSVAVPAHLVTVFLLPSYLWLLWSDRSSVPRRALHAVLPVAGVAALFLLLGFGWSDAIRPFRHAADAAGSATGGFGFSWAEMASSRRLNDLVNLALLVATAPLLAFLARLSGWRASSSGRSPLLAGLAWAAVPGVAVAAFLVLPGSPAQDWDLMAITILPAAVLAVAAAQPVLADEPAAGRVGLGLLSAGTLLAFVLVNADPVAGPRRFAALIGEGSALSPHEQAYGNEKLVQYHVTRGENEAALGYAERMVQAEPTNPRYWVKAGATLCNMGRYLEAVPYFEEALRRGPGRADAIYNLGLCYARTQRVPEAIAAFRAAVAADPAQPDYRHNLGVVLYSAGMQDSARVVWEDVLRRWPGYPLTVRAWERRFGSRPPSYPSPSSSSPSSSNPR